ncbi:MAG: PriCT-2 domain-containing protein [Propionivibrio sp.]|uniref:DNA-primase RepB domain-containing protein n=1 Tax=Propionivibrio sp. TaxID=2212460 RepID=UPI0025E22594|nr:DNA-primase RepB domain-containing protein [Propionivibrio sp.]MBK8892535.1 PriCT-2 domain-containing protein [Propionivibrio sp.]
MNKMNTAGLHHAGYGEAAAVIEAIHGGYSCTVVRFKRGAHGLYVACGYCHGTFAEQVELFPSYQVEGIEPFLMAGAPDGEGTTDANVLHTWTVCVDFDDGYPDFLATNPLVGPSLLIETSPGRYHAIWILDRPYSIAEAKPVLKAMALRLGGDVAYAKASQLIRLPGFLNAKRQAIARLVEPTNLHKPYLLDFLKEAFDVDLIINGVRSALPRFNACLDVPRNKGNDNDAAEQAADVASALPYLKDYAEDYGDWVSTLMALVPLGDRGKQLAEEFSRYSIRFDQQAFEKKWSSLQGHPGRVATIFLRAQNSGWKNPGFRRTSVDANRVFTDRDLGRLIANKLGDDFAAIANTQGSKHQITLHRWSGEAFVPISDIDRRKVVEDAGNQVVKALADNGLKHEAVVKLKHKLGTNRTLDEVCEHVAEQLIPGTEAKLVGNYPYFAVANGVLNLLTQQLIPARYRPVPVRAD